MVNFNTKAMKIAFSKIKPDVVVQPLPDDSITSLKLAIEWALEKEVDQTIIVAYDGYYLMKEHYQSIVSYVDRFGPKFLTKLSDLLVIRSGDCVVTIKLNGSSEMYAVAPANNEENVPPVISIAVADTPLKANTRKSAHAAKPTAAAKKPPSGCTRKMTITTPSKSKKRKTAGSYAEPAKVQVEANGDDDEEFGALTQECIGLFF